MSDDSFLIHLISNVAPETFPNNNPSKFSTPLANEIDLSAGSWEVGVRQIMYPTHVSTTSEEDKIYIYYYKRDFYRSLLPVPQSKDATGLKNIATFFTLPPPPKDYKLAIYFHVMRSFNFSTWARDQHLFKMEYMTDTNKFVFHLQTDDIVVYMNKAMSTYLGFKKEQCFTRNTYWAWTPFQNAKAPEDMALMMFDLQSLESEEHTLPVSFDEKTKQRIYSKVIPYKFTDTLPDKWFPEALFSITVDTKEKVLKFAPVIPVPQEIKRHMKMIAFFHFDSKTQLKLNLDGCDIENANDKVINIPFTTEERDFENTHFLKIKLYFSNLRELNRPMLLPEPITTINVKNEKEVKTPKDLLPILNSKSHIFGYKFLFNKSISRFELEIGETYAIQMSKTLADILGFDESASEILHTTVRMRALTFPVLHRAITALYIYTNIIDPVYVGDVKAPLLLTCPFKKQEKFNITNQQEFLNPCYTPLNRSKIQQIDIAIYDDAGTLIPFLYGKTKLSLHFRRRN